MVNIPEFSRGGRRAQGHRGTRAQGDGVKDEGWNDGVMPRAPQRFLRLLNSDSWLLTSVFSLRCPASLDDEPAGFFIALEFEKALLARLLQKLAEGAEAVG